MLFKSNKGFSLISSMMIAIPMMAFLMGTVAFMSNKDMQREQVAKAQSDIDALSGTIIAVARHPNLCMNNLNFGGGSTYIPDEATSEIGQPVISLIPAVDGGAYTVPNAKIDTDDYFMNTFGMRVADLRFVETESNGNQRIGDLVMTTRASAERRTLLNFGPRILGRLALTVDVGNNISKCIAGGSPQQLCENIGGRYDPALTPNCRMGYPDITCGAGEYIQRINSDGTPLCANANISCNPATEGYLVGMINGLKVCRRFASAGTPPTPTPPPTPTAAPGFGALVLTDANCPGVNCECEITAVGGPLGGQQSTITVNGTADACYNAVCDEFEIDHSASTNNILPAGCDAYTVP